MILKFELLLYDYLLLIPLPCLRPIISMILLLAFIFDKRFKKIICICLCMRALLIASCLPRNDKFQETEKDNVDATPKLEETPKVCCNTCSCSYFGYCFSNLA